MTIARAGTQSPIVPEPCKATHATCGHIFRALDPTGRVPGQIEIGFRLYRHTDRGVKAAGTIVATEGGPGFATIGSAAEYLGLFGPLLDQNDLLLVDNRGTGASDPIDCRELQTMPTPSPAAVGACGRALGNAAWLYGTPLVADDIAAVLDALGIARVNLYGDSYGTFTAQIFAQRHPDKLRSLVLDGAFATRGESGFFPNTPAAIRRNIDLVCTRAPDCRALAGTPSNRLRRLLERVRVHAITGLAPDANGKRVAATVDSAAIGTILYDATYDPLNLRESDAAVRAALDLNDDLPLLRLAAETPAHADSRDAGGDPHYFSYGLAAAVSCADYPQIYDMTVPPGARHAGRDAALAQAEKTDPDLYAPLTIREWAGLPLDYAQIDMCLDWPVATAPLYPAGQPVSASAAFPSVPVLVLSGELDTTTPPADADLAAGQFPHAQHVMLANSLHVDALGDDHDCASVLVRRFVATLDPGDAACADRIPPIRLVKGFWVKTDAVTAAEPEGSDEAPEPDRRIAAAIVDTAADILDRNWRRSGSEGAGLRGGHFHVAEAGDSLQYRLDGVRWTEDLAVSGMLRWNRVTGLAEVRLTAKPADGHAEDVRARWNTNEADGRVAITMSNGGAGGEKHAWMPVP